MPGGCAPPPSSSTPPPSPPSMDLPSRCAAPSVKSVGIDPEVRLVDEGDTDRPADLCRRSGRGVRFGAAGGGSPHSVRARHGHHAGRFPPGHGSRTALRRSASHPGPARPAPAGRAIGAPARRPPAPAGDSQFRQRAGRPVRRSDRPGLGSGRGLPTPSLPGGADRRVPRHRPGPVEDLRETVRRAERRHHLGGGG